MNVLGYNGTMEHFKSTVLPILEEYRLKLKFKIESHGILGDYLNSSIVFDIKNNLIKVISYIKPTNTHSYVPFTSMHQITSFKSCIDSLCYSARCLNDDDTVYIVIGNCNIVSILFRKLVLVLSFAYFGPLHKCSA